MLLGIEKVLPFRVFHFTQLAALHRNVWVYMFSEVGSEELFSEYFQIPEILHFVLKGIIKAIGQYSLLPVQKWGGLYILFV